MKTGFLPNKALLSHKGSEPKSLEMFDLANRAIRLFRQSKKVIISLCCCAADLQLCFPHMRKQVLSKEANNNGLPLCLSKINTFSTCCVQNFCSKFSVNRKLMSCIMRKPTFWFPTWSDINQAVQLQKIARGLKFRI